MPPSNRVLAPNRTTALRALLIFCLAVAVAICVSLSYVFLRNSERQIGLQTYESVATMALSGAQAITHRRIQGSKVTATLMSQILPNHEAWPLIDFTGFIPITSKVANLSETSLHALMVLVDPSQVEAFEMHTQRIYQVEGRPEKAGWSAFGFGIWKHSPNSTHGDRRVHDTTGETSWGGRRRILAPNMLISQPNVSALMYNAYSEQERGFYIDAMLDCVDRHVDVTATASPECAVVTDMLEIIIRPGPAAVFFQPIFPANEPTQVVGFVSFSFHWQDILERIVPSFVSGLTCVIQTGTKSFTYEIENGKPILIGNGDHHQRHHSHRGKDIQLNMFTSKTVESANYTLTVYPTDELINTFSTKSPIFIALGFFAVISAVAFVFLMYDHFMRYEAHQRKAILDMKRRFVRFISHEIRTPLNTVCTGVELLESEMRAVVKQDADHKVYEIHDGEESEIPFWHEVTIDIKENAAVAVSILNDLLNYDKIESNTMTLELGQVCMSELLEKTVNQFRIQAINAKIDLRLDCHDLPVSFETSDVELGCKTPSVSSSTNVAVYGDHIKLAQVIRNLVSNAVKFTPPNGSISITACHDPIGLKQSNARKPDSNKNATICSLVRNGSLVISVKDTGAGLTREQLQMLFTEGVQFEANRLQNGGGSGLGLSIAHGIVRQHGGTLRAHSDGPNKGCTFTLELPMYQFDAAQQDIGKVSPQNETNTVTEAASLQSCPENAERCVSHRVLVVEDSESSRKMLIRLLERSGHRCMPASNGEEAVNAIRLDMEMMKGNAAHTPIDTILMDFEMPVMKGPPATRAIRDLSFGGSILGVTGNVLSEDVACFKEHGADDVLAKPVSMSRIQAFWKKQHN